MAFLRFYDAQDFPLLGCIAKYDALRRKSGITSTPPTTTDEN
jgi:hypothetical protein